MAQDDRQPQRGAGLFRLFGDRVAPAATTARERNHAAADPPDALGLYLHEIGQISLLGPAAERELAQRIEQGDAGALHALVQANLRLVVSIAKRYANHGVGLLDLIQEGNLGLLRAATRFDWRRGVRFPTYASWWIRQAITQALTRQRRAIRLPARMSETVRRLRRLQRDLVQALGREPELTELAEAAGLSPARVAFALQVAQQIASLDEQTGDADTDDLGALLPDAAADPAAEVAQQLLQAELEQALLDLPARDYQVLALRFGLGGAGTHSLVEVGRQLGISREQARRLEQTALQALRRRLDGEAGPALMPTLSAAAAAVS